MKQDKASCGGSAIYRFDGQDHQLSDWGVRRLSLATRPRLHRTGALLAEGLDQRSSPDSGRARAGPGRLHDQAPAGPGDDRAGYRGGGAVCLVRGRQPLRRWTWPSLLPGVPWALSSTPWCGSKAVAGRSGTASEPPRSSSASITMKPAPGTAHLDRAIIEEGASRDTARPQPTSGRSEPLRRMEKLVPDPPNV